MVLLLIPILDTVDILDLLDILDTVPMVPILMLGLMAATLPTVLIHIWDKKEASIPCSMKNLNFPQK